MRKFLLLFLLLSSFALAQQSQPAPKIMRLGMTAADLHAQFGQPQSIFAAEAQAYITPAEYQGLRVRHGLYWEVFSRKTQRNEYQLSVLFRADESESHLHPTLRVKEVHFKFDKDMSREEFLGDIAEARELCASKCELGRSKYGDDPIAITPDRATRFSFMSTFVTMSDNKSLEAIES